MGFSRTLATQTNIGGDATRHVQRSGPQLASRAGNSLPAPGNVPRGTGHAAPCRIGISAALGAWQAYPSTESSIMDQLRLAKVALILGTSVWALACSSEPGAGEGSDGTSRVVAMNEPAPPASPAPSMEAAPSEPGAAAGQGEGQPANVGLVPAPMDGAQPAAESPVAESPPAPEPAPPAAGGAPVRSAGCGSTQAVQSGRVTMDVAGTAREYILELPDDYDASRAYRLIFAWHWRGGNAAQVANGFYGLQERADDSAIFVSAEGIDAGWANPGGRDIAFLDSMLARFQSELCVDQSRIFSTGWSYGGMMSLAIGCARGDVFRAIAPMSGALYSGCEDGDNPVAFLGFHGNTDDVVPFGNGVTARNVFVERNGCQPESAAVEVDGCQRFEGCAAGFPVTWCEFDGGHTPAPGSEQAIWDFFAQF